MKGRYQQAQRWYGQQEGNATESMKRPVSKEELVIADSARKENHLNDIDQ
jgi:hypothetical protein